MPYAIKDYIKNVRIELRNYPIGGVNQKNEDKGNSDLSERLFVQTGAFDELKKHLSVPQRSLSVLVTGYRGMGKSFLVKKVLKQICKETEEDKKATKGFIGIEASLSRNEDSEIGVFRKITQALASHEKLKGKHLKGKHLKGKHLKGKHLFEYTLDFRFFLYALTCSISIVSLTMLMIYLYMGWQMLFTVRPGIFNLILDFWRSMSAVFGPNSKIGYSLFDWIQSGAVVTALFLIALFSASNLNYMLNKEKKRKFHLFWIRKRLNSLYDRLIYNMEKESGLQTTSASLPGLISRQRKSMVAGDAKSVQIELKNLMDELSNYFTIYVVLDELDKLEPEQLFRPYYESMESAEKRGYVDGGEDLLRARRIQVMQLISSLKYFITETPAKFIFIAGREMFDAALADISDRHSALSSAFHHVVYVDSFLKANSSQQNKGAGITENIEQMLECLIFGETAENFRKGALEHSTFLGRFRHRLTELHKSGNDTNSTRDEYYKVIFTLQQFIIFLAYRSNGSPKKLVRLIQEHIVEDNTHGNWKDIDVHWDGVDHENARNIESVDKTTALSSRHYLQFRYHDQFRFGLINYFFRPFLITNSKNLHNITDQNLVMTSYLMDHILKFHVTAFSKRDFQLLPEMLSTMRTPALKWHIDELQRWFELSWVRETEVGFFEYKFFQKISHDITNLTRLFEEEMAAWNFTLDESFSIKQLLRTKIKELRSIYKSFRSTDDKVVLRSIAYENSLLGDAHLYEEEFVDAIEAYLDGLFALDARLESLKAAGNAKRSSAQLLHEDEALLVSRMLLKISLAYEKMADCDSAVAYLDRCVQFIGNHSGSVLLKHKAMASLAKLYVAGVTKSNLDYRGEVTKIFNAYTVGNSGSNSLDVYVLSHLGVIEFFKNSVQRIPNDPFPNDSVLQEFYVTGSSKYERKPTAALDIYLTALQKLCIANTEETLSGYLRRIMNDILMGAHNVHYGFIQERWTEAARILSRIGDTLYSMLTFEEDNSNAWLRIIDMLWEASKSKEDDESFNENNQRKEQTKVHYCILNLLDHQSRYSRSTFSGVNYLLVHRINLIVLCYLVSSELYLKAGKSVSCSFQFRKVFYFFESMIRIPVTDRILYATDLYHTDFRDTQNLTSFVSNGAPSQSSSRCTYFKTNHVLGIFLMRILRVASWNTKLSSRNQVFKYRDLMGVGVEDAEDDFFKSRVFLNLSNAAEIKEALYPMARIRIEFINFEEEVDKIEHNYAVTFLTRFGSVNSMFSRFLELKYQAALNDRLIDPVRRVLDLELDPKRIDFKNPDPDLMLFLAKPWDYIEVILNQVYVLHTAVQHHQKLGVGFMMSHTSLGVFHRKLARYRKYIEAIIKSIEGLKSMFSNNGKEPMTEQTIEDLLKDLLNHNIYKMLDVTTQQESAYTQFYAALEFHRDGAAFSDAVTNMYFLEDDYSDHLYHFSAAAERYQINSGRVRENIDKLNKQGVWKSKLLDVRNIFVTTT